MRKKDHLQLEIIECDCIVLTQQLNRHGVCIIPDKQDKAALDFIVKLGRTFTHIEGSNRSMELRYYFEPELSETEMEELE